MAMAAVPIRISGKCFTSDLPHFNTKLARHSFQGLLQSHKSTLTITNAAKDGSDSPSNASNESPSVSEPGAPVEPRMLAVEAKFTSRRRKKKEEAASQSSAWPEREIKPWEKMSVKEKAWEVYTGNKGVLFYLNKAAWITIFVIAGGWIAFRFLGPALGLYQLQNELLAPDKLFSGS